jgi:uncharacterized protein (DUF2225 family)
MTTFYPISLTCPVCDEIFTSNEIGSCGYGSKRTDFRPNYWGFNPVIYFYHLCPSCGFCARKKIFESKLDNQELREELNKIGPISEDSLSKKLERAIICLEIMNDLGITKKNNFELANSWLDPYWWAESNKEEIKFGKVVLNYFEKAFNEEQVPTDQIFAVKYLIAEINRRIGNAETANIIFDEVISLTENNKEQEFIHNLAIQQKTNPKENL